MKQDNRNHNPVLSGTKLEFFYGILTLWESAKSPKVVNNFKSAEVKQFLSQTDSRGIVKLLVTADQNKKCTGCRYSLYVNDSKKNIGLSLLYHLRNAFAHNNIELCDQRHLIIINHIWKGKTKLQTKIPFSILKELIETIRGNFNPTPIDNIKKKNQIKRKQTKSK